MKGRESSIKKLIGKSKKWRNGIKNEDETKKQVMNELAEMRQRITELEASETRRKQAEEKLRESDAKYSTLVESSRDGIIIIQDSVLKFVNTASMELVGYTPEEMLDADFLNFVVPGYWELVLRRYTDRMAGKKVPSVYEIELSRKDGTTLPVELNAVRIDFHGKPADLVFIRDITKRKRMEEKKNRAMHNLGELVKELTCLYGIEEISRREGITVEEILKETVQLIPPSWQYPEITGDRITFQGEKYKTENFEKTKWIQKANIIVDNKKAGLIEVCYLKEKPEKDEGPFLREERNLIDSIAAQLGLFIERKRAEESLRESEEKFRTFMETASDLMHITDKDGNLTYVNESMARTLGYSREEMIEMHIGQVISEESMKDFEPGWKELVTKGRFAYEPTWITKDGKEVRGEIKVVAIYDSDGKYAGARAVFRDITERKKAEEQIKIQKSYFENLFEMSPDALVTIDKDDRIIQINKEFTNLFGYQNDEAVGKQINDLIVPPEHKEEGLAASRLIVKGERVHFESVRQAKDGRNIEVEIISKPVILGKDQLASQDIYRDITDRKRMEEELIRLANAVRMSTDSIVISDIKGKIIDVNEATLKMYGTEDKRDLIGKSSFDLIVPEEREKALESLKKVLKGGYVTGREYHIITKDGSKILVEMNSAIMKDTNGKPIGFVGMTRDITERKRMEEALKEDEERLRTILNHLQAGIAVIDEETHEIVDVNSMAVEMIGIPKEEIIGRICHKFICPAEAGKCPITDLGQSIDNSERVLINADGEEIPILKTATSIMLKNRGFIIDSFIDVSEQKRTEEKLRESEERFRTIVETAPSLLSITDAKGNHIYVSPNCEEITGYTQEELLSGVRWWVHEDDMPRAKELFERTFREGMGGKRTSNTKRSKRTENCGMLQAPGSRLEIRKGNSRALSSRRLTSPNASEWRKH